MKRIAVAWISALVLCSASVVLAQAGDTATDGPLKETEQGIPVTHPVVIAKCGGCHAQDEKGNMSRISWARTTPEGWSQAIKRMVRQNGLQLDPQDARAIVKYLATRHGLAPEEAKPVMYIAEHRTLDETNIPNETIRQACAACHSFAQPLSWRRSKTDWKLLQNLHVALYSQADVQFRRTVGGGGAEAPGGQTTPPGTPPPPKPVDVALEYLNKTAPLQTSEWAAWQSRIRPPRLAGKWLVTATMPGHGTFVGDMTIAPGPVEDEFKTSVTLRSLKDGSVIRRSGTGLVYAGYSWRGNSNGGARRSQPEDIEGDAREVMWFSPDQSAAQGRWFWGDYQEFGFDVKLTRATANPTVVSVGPLALKAGAKTARLKILGDGFAGTVAPTDLDLGAGVRLARIVSQSPSELVVDVDVAADALSGQRDVGVRGAVLEKAFAVYHTVDTLKVTPETAIARLGGNVYPKGYQQFEAVGFENGLDGKPGTADDLRLGPIDVSWSIEEFMTVYNDDDRKFVGSLSQNAFFTPATEGPNPARRFSRNNYGEVWVQATAKAEKDKFSKPLSARSYLVVTVPTYLRWDQPEVTR